MRPEQLGAVLAVLAICGCDDSPSSSGSSDAPSSSPPPAATTTAPAATAHVDESMAGVWRCPDHPGQMNSVKGDCPTCGKPFELTPTALVWVCLEHPVIVRDAKGLCSICERSLKPMTMARVWLCPDHASARSNRPGKCPRCGFDLEEELESIPHGDHNPRHGGQFFMAPDLWHHLEGTMPIAGEFRIHLYDDFTEPLAADRATGSIAYRTAPDGDEDEDDAEAPRKNLDLRASGDAKYLIATIPPDDVRFPLEIRADLAFTSDPDDAYAFDFYFEGITEEEKAKTGATQVIAQTEGDIDSGPIDWSKSSARELIAELATRANSIDELVAKQRWTELFRPAIEAKDIALELATDDRRRELGLGEDAGGGGGGDAESTAASGKRKKRADWATREIVRGAWLLELHGDAGNGERVRAAHEVFARGFVELKRSTSADAPKQRER